MVEETGTSASRLATFMAENYAKPVTMSLGEWLRLNPPPVLCERKVDGFRVFVYKSGGNILIATRHGRIYSQNSHPALFRRIRPLMDSALPHRMILDGEYVSPDRLFLFDILRIDEEETTSLHLDQRREILSTMLRKTRSEKDFEITAVRAASYAEIMDFMNDLVSKGEEGIVVKNPNSKYGQRNSWLKLKRFNTVDCFVTRYESTKEMEKTGIPHSWFIALYNNSGELVEMGKVGTYLKQVDPRRVKIGTVVEIQYQDVTEDLKFRHPHINKIREDKKPQECTMDQIPSIKSSQPRP